jgi:hypothetical protein
MSNTILTPNMNLPLPVPGVDPGIDYALNNNLSFSALDAHNHTTGKGLQIPSSGLNINADLPINNNNMTLARSVRFLSQSAVLALAADLGCLFVSGNELYYNDEAGNHIQITKTGSVNAGAGSISGLPSGTASASYASSTFVFQSATNTAASVDGASYIFRNSTANSKGLTLNPPNAMAANYSLTLPAIPSTKSIMAIDTSGNMSGSYTVDNTTIDINGSSQIEVKALGIGTAQLAALSVTAAKIANATITTTQISATAGITGSQLANSTITGTQIATGTITGSLIAGSTITTANIASSTIQGGNIASLTITGANIANTTISSAKLTANIYTVSSSTGAYTYNSNTLTTVTSIHLTGNSGRFVQVGLYPDGSGTACYVSSDTVSYFRLRRNSTVLGYFQVNSLVPSTVINIIDLSPGTDPFYYLDAQSGSNGSNTYVFYSSLFAMEV